MILYFTFLDAGSWILAKKFIFSFAFFHRWGILTNIIIAVSISIPAIGGPMAEIWMSVSSVFVIWAWTPIEACLPKTVVKAKVHFIYVAKKGRLQFISRNKHYVQVNLLWMNAKFNFDPIYSTLLIKCINIAKILNIISFFVTK